MEFMYGMMWKELLSVFKNKRDLANLQVLRLPAVKPDLLGQKQYTFDYQQQGSYPVPRDISPKDFHSL